MLAWDAQKQQAGVGIATPDVMVTKSSKPEMRKKRTLSREKNPYYWSEDREKKIKRNALNRNRRGRK